MLPQGSPTPLAGAQQVSRALLRSNSGFMGGQGGGISSQNAFPSLVSPRNQINNMSMLGNVPNIPSLLHQPFGNDIPSSGLSGPGSSQRGLIDGGTESDRLTNVGNDMEFDTQSSSYLSSSIATNSNLSGQVQGRQQFSSPSASQMLTDQQQAQQPDPQSFQQNSQSMQQFSVPNNPQQQSQSQQQQQQFQAMKSGLAGIGSVKLEPQMTSEEAPPPHLQSLRNLGTVKLEPQQLQSMRSLIPVKTEPQHSEPSMFLQQQQQQQLLLSGQSSQAAAAAQILQQQRLMQIQHQQQQQLLKSMPQQRSPMPPQIPSQSIPFRSPVKSVYEPGMCARRLTHYMYQQQHRPDDNNIEFWRKFVAEYFAPNAKKKWCVSMYGNGRQTTGVFPQDVWQCEICNRRPRRGFEATAEVLPRLFKIKYESGIIEELLYVDMPREYQNSSGQIVLDYAKAIQESVFEQLRVVRDGQLRVVFSPDLKICSWEFCARRHEELIPRRLLIPLVLIIWRPNFISVIVVHLIFFNNGFFNACILQFLWLGEAELACLIISSVIWLYISLACGKLQVGQLGTAAQKYQAATQKASSNMSVSELQNNCDMFVASARQLAKVLEVPLVNDLGYTKRYVRCLQISEVVNSMKDLIDYSRETGAGPMDSLAKFPRRTNPSLGFQVQSQQPEGQLLQQQQQQQRPGQNSNNDNPVQSASMQLASNGMPNMNNTINSVPATSSTGTSVALLHQNSINSRQQNPMSGANGAYGGSGVQMPSPGASSSMPQTQPPSSSFQSQTPSSSNTARSTPHGSLLGAPVSSSVTSQNVSMQQPALSGDTDANDSQSSVQKIIHDMLMSSQLSEGGMMGMGTMGGSVKNVNGMLPSNNTSINGSSHILLGNGLANGNPNIGSSGFGIISNRLGQSPVVNGIRAPAGNNSLSISGRVSLAMARDLSTNQQQQQQQQQDVGNQLLGGLGAVNNFSNLQFDWKGSP